MAGQAILGETLLKSAMAMETAAAPTVETLVADHSRMVFRIAYSILCNHHDAEDAAQEGAEPAAQVNSKKKKSDQEAT
jgi:DNA-directed RNA polymerase specialized sigma24 family protein